MGGHFSFLMRFEKFHSTIIKGRQLKPFVSINRGKYLRELLIPLMAKLCQGIPENPSLLKTFGLNSLLVILLKYFHVDLI